MRRDVLAALNAERAARRAAILVTDLGDGAVRLVREAEIAADPLAEALFAALAAGASRIVAEAGRERFLTVCLPPPRLVVIGAVHISQALAPMARLVGLDLTILDPRTAFATPERFPGVTLLPVWPEEGLARIGGLDRFAALAALTHDPKIDDPALAAALRAGCFYVGALGSRRTHARRVERLAALGIAPEDLARIHAPIGLDIGAASPAEIALSVLAEIVAALRRPRLREAAHSGAAAGVEA